MKETNKIIRSKKLSEIEKHDRLIELGCSEDVVREVFTPNYMGKLVFQAIPLPTMEPISAELKDSWRKPSR